jgi:hypothetical protein
METCFKLFSCDGSYYPFNSNDHSLSGYVDTFITIDLLTPLTGSPETQFLVKDLGEIECVTGQTFNIVSTAETCNCQCYIFKTPNEPILTTYVDCDYNLLEVYLPTGQTTSICSLVRPIFNIIDQFTLKLGGICISGECPDYNITATIEPRNECDVLTIFPMVVDCLVIHPSKTNSFNGIATLIITGGTSPYTITWSTGSIAPLIYNLNVGSYDATIVDFYGDYTAYTTCVLTGITSTTTTTTTLNPLPVYGNLCVTITTKNGISKVEYIKNTQIQFEPYNITNGTQSWLSNDSGYFMYFSTGATNQWVISASTQSTGTIVNNNSETPPIIGWQALGNPAVIGLSVISGDCGTNKEITLNVTKNDYVCENKGSINIQAYGGTPPYGYSINNGSTFSTTSVFTNLIAGQYLIVVKDSLGNLSTPQSKTIIQVTPQSYALTLTINQTNKTFQVQASNNLPINETITFTLAQTSLLSYYPFNLSPEPIYTNDITFNDGLGTMDYDSTTLNQNVLSLNCSNSPVTENQKSINYTKQLTISSGQIISGLYTDNLVFEPNGNCESASKLFKLYLLNDYKLSNCSCCDVKIINPPQVSLFKV